MQNTTRAPFNKCYLCGSFDGPFIDTFVDQFGHGAVFICAPRYDPTTGEEEKTGCLGQMAKHAGYCSRYEVQLLHELLGEMQSKITELESRETQLIIPEGELRQYITELAPQKEKFKVIREE